MTKHVAMLSVLTLIASATNYASNAIFSRILDPVGFGEWSSLLALAIILSVPTGAAQTVIAERVASYSATGRQDIVRYMLRHALFHVALMAGVVTAIYVALIPAIVPLLNLRHAGPALALAPVLFLGFVQPVALGALQGLDRFILLGFMMVAMSLARIAVGVPLSLVAGRGSGAAIAGQAIGMAVVFAVSIFVLRDRMPRRGTGAAKSGLRRRPDRRALLASTSFVAFAVISNLDLVLARLYLNSEDAGIYAAIATVGKIVIFLPAAVAVVAVPQAARALQEGQSSASVLRFAALLVAGTAALIAVPAAIAPEPLVRLMFGQDYTAAADGVLPIVVAGAGLSLLNLLVVFTVAVRDNRWVRVLIVGVALQIVGISLFHSSPAQIATVQAIVIGILLIVNERWFHALVLRRAEPARRTEPAR